MSLFRMTTVVIENQQAILCIVELPT